MSKILIMKIYFDNFSIPLTKLKELKKNERENVWFLSYFGKYKISQNKIILYKIKDTKHIITKLNNYSCCISHEKWEKTNELHYLPKDTIPIKIKKEIYHIDNKLFFIIEKLDDEVNDYYFETQYDLDDFCLKNELISFLQT